VVLLLGGRRRVRVGMDRRRRLIREWVERGGGGGVSLVLVLSLSRFSLMMN
jgi:hypothetical protein